MTDPSQGTWGHSHLAPIHKGMLQLLLLLEGDKLWPANQMIQPEQSGKFWPVSEAHQPRKWTSWYCLHSTCTLEDNSFWSLRRMGDWRIWFFHFCRRQANFHTFKTLHQCQECLLTDTKCQKTLQNHKIKTLHILSSTSSHQSCRRGSS